MSRFFSNARFATVLAVAAVLFATGIASGAAGQALIIGAANSAGTSNTSLNTNSTGFAWQMQQTGSGVGVYAISANGNALAALAHNGNKYGLSATNDGSAGTGAAIIADGRANTGIDIRTNSSSIAPLKVNSTGLVTNLNVDYVDGFDASDITRVEYGSTTNAPDSGTLVSASITAPTRGWFHISASADTYNFTDDDYISCHLDVDGDAVTGSYRYQDLTASSNSEEDCNTNGGVSTCGGASSISLILEDVTSANTHVDNAVIEVVFTPFDGTGSLPSIFGCLIITGPEPATKPGAPAK
jgi:hypothetical protein